MGSGRTCRELLYILSWEYRYGEVDVYIKYRYLFVFAYLFSLSLDVYFWPKVFFLMFIAIWRYLQSGCYMSYYEREK